jgi:predicted CXXCH cytochrome family protein
MICRSKMIEGALSILVVMFAVGLASGQPQQQSCQTSKCHEEMGKGEWVHGPVGVGACVVCHNPVEGEDHEFTFPAERAELCFACHENSRDLMLEANIHTPVAEGDCTGCHDPHQSDFRFTLKGDAKTLCFKCHDQGLFTGASVHGPVAEGDCNACHNPHASAYTKQLLDDPINICFTCHDDRSNMMAMRHVHPPVSEGCMSCHEAHAGQAAKLLTLDTPGLCFGCHVEMAASADVTHQHTPVAAGQCESCHDPHASEFPKMFPQSPEELCFSCHTELGDYVKTQTHLHGPVGEGDCSACHDPHGSDYYRILRKYFPEEFYTSYAESNYSSCFECHNHQIAMEAETETLTDFRDGERNLHYLHVNKDVKGRSCKACHQVHASTQEKHIRLSVPYGTIDWELPVTFTKTKDGGSCQVGCHAPKGYKR